MADGLLTLEQAADYLGVSVRAMRLLRQTRRVAAIKLSHRTIRFAKADLDRFVDSCREEVVQ